MVGPTELTGSGLHTLSNGAAAGTPHDPALAVVVPPGDWSLTQISAREVFLAPGAHLTLTGATGQEGAAALPLVSHLYDLYISPGAVLDSIGSALQEDLTFIAPGGTLALASTSGNAAADLPIKLGILTNGGSLQLNTPAYYTQSIQLPGSQVTNPSNLLLMPNV